MLAGIDIAGGMPLSALANTPRYHPRTPPIVSDGMTFRGLTKKTVGSWESKYINKPIIVITTARQLSMVLANMAPPIMEI